MLITVPFVLVGIFRYQLLSDRELNNIKYIQWKINNNNKSFYEYLNEKEN